MVTGIVNGTTPPNVLGYPITFYAIDDRKDYISNYKWEVVCTNPGCSPTYQGLNSGPTWSYQDFPAIKTGSHRLRLTVTYARKPDGSPGINPTTHYLDFFINGPNKTVLLTALPKKATWNSGITLVFQMQYNDIPLGANFQGFPQEQVEDALGNILIPWSPPGALPSGSAYYRQGNCIYDTWSNDYTQAQWDALGIGLYSSVVQTHRLVATDCCGQQKAFKMSPFALSRRKISATEWQIER